MSEDSCEHGVYQSLEQIQAELGEPRTLAELRQLIATGSAERLGQLCVVLGEAWEPPAEAQNLLLELAVHADQHVRSMAWLGLGYFARVQGKLDQRRVKPLLLQALRSEPEVVGFSLDDIRHFLGWQTGEADTPQLKALRRQQDRQRRRER